MNFNVKNDFCFSLYREVNVTQWSFFSHRFELRWGYDCKANRGFSIATSVGTEAECGIGSKWCRFGFGIGLTSFKISF